MSEEPTAVLKKSKVKLLRDTDEAKEHMKSKGPCMIVIYADWCGHCKHAAPAWAELAEKVNGKATVYAIESEKYEGDDVKGYPTIKIVKNGGVSDYEGDRSVEDMKSKLLGSSGGRRARRNRTRRFRNRTRKTHRSLS